MGSRLEWRGRGVGMETFPKGMDPRQAELLYREVKKKIDEDARRPFTVSVLGQTGVGKSSLLNALLELS
jgi:putative ribosome biogenesis GTPase RsgA